MNETPKEQYAAVASGRNALNLAILASGEIWVGFTTNLAIRIEMGWRSLIAMVPIFWRKKC